MNITDKPQEFTTDFGTITEHNYTNHDGVANTKFKPYSWRQFTATVNGIESPKFHAKGHALNWLKRQAN